MADHRLQLRVLTEESVQEIEKTAYRLLAEVGVALDHPRAVEMLSGMG